MPDPQTPKLYDAGRRVVRPADPAPPYAELSCATNYSLLRGASHPDELVFRAAELGYSALAVTDLNSVAGVVKAHKALAMVREQSGGSHPMRLVIGCRLRLVDAPDVLVWCATRGGYAALCRLLTAGKRRAAKGECLLSREDLLADHAGLLAAVVPSGHDLSDLEISLRPLREAMGERLSLAAAVHHRGDDVRRLARLSELSRLSGVPLLATNDAAYHARGRRPLQDVLTCVRHGRTVHDAGHLLFPNGERHLKPPAAMHSLFAGHPRAVRRGLEVAEQCTFSLDELKYQYPDELVPDGMTAIAHLADLARAGAARRYPGGVPASVTKRLADELRLIEQLKYEPYFLTVEDAVRFARSRGILCQGRGSAANSAVCYCLGVTAVDPAKSDLLFERFVSAARDEPPDIDVDFEHERREEVIQYVYAKYGRDRAAMTAEVITYRGRSAVRDVGKALGLGLDAVDRMAKQLDHWERGVMTPEQLRAAGLDPADRAVRQVVHLTAQLLGFPRHLGQHVGGMVMTRGPLCEMVPVANAAMANRTVIEWDKDDIDAVGMMKVDLLGLGMLTALRKSMDLAGVGRAEDGPPLELHTLPPECPAVYDMACDADTVGVFQIESRAQMSMLPRLRPRCFYDLVVEVAIVRPGPIQGDMVHPYLRRRGGTEAVTYPNDALREVLGRTLGVPLFQEQVMKLAMVAAGFSAVDADRLRRAMAAWRRDGNALAPYHRRIIDGMTANGYERAYAERVFEQIKGFGEYGFPESHAASFALLVYASCWLKRHRPAAFCCGLLNSQPMGFYAPAQLVRDAREHGVEVRPVDVNASDWDCTLEEGSPEPPGESGDHKRTWGHGGPAVRLGMRQVRGMRRADADRIAAARRSVGRFTSVEHLHRAAGVSAAAVRRLAGADAFGSLSAGRRDAAWDAAALDDHPAPLFAHLSPPPDDRPPLPPLPAGGETMADYAATGLSLKAHPLAHLRPRLLRRGAATAAELRDDPAGDLRHGRHARVAGLVLVRQRPGTASGVMFATLEDETGVANLIVKPAVYDRFKPAARHARLLLAEGVVQRQGKVVHLLADRLADLSGLLEHLRDGGPAPRLPSRDFH